jgi:hypothetical protein
VSLYLQQLLRANDVMFDDDEILQAPSYGTNLPDNAVCSCYHPVRTDDGGTAYV